MCMANAMVELAVLTGADGSYGLWQPWRLQGYRASMFSATLSQSYCF